MSFQKAYPKSMLQTFRERSETIGNCNECCRKTRLLACNHCNNAICCQESCSILFPHIADSLFVICNTCRTTIEEKIVTAIDYSKLILLKKKINKKRKLMV